MTPLVNLNSHFLLFTVLFTFGFTLCSSYSPFTSSSSNGRTLDTTSNLDCADYSSCSELSPKPDLVYTHSTDNETSIHFISSTLGGFPGFLITRTDTSESLSIDWDSLLNDCHDSFKLASVPDGSIGVLFLSFFNLDHKDIQWKLDENTSNCDSSSCSFGYLTTLASNQNSVNQTSISIALEIRNSQFYFEDFPHLLLTPSSMHIDVQIQNLDKSQIDEKFGGIKLLIFTSLNTLTTTLERSIDDEHSPGVFSKQTFLFSDDNQNNSFIQYKPVAYDSTDRVMSNTMEIESSTLKNTELPKLNLPLYCFKKQFYPDEPAYKLNVSFVPDDDSTSKNIDLIAWSLAFGLDKPPKDGLSLFLQLMLFVGVGLSLIVMFASIIFVIIKKWQKSRGSSELLVNENILDY